MMKSHGSELVGILQQLGVVCLGKVRRCIKLGPEDQLCVAIASRLMEETIKGGLLFFHVPNNRGSSVLNCVKNKMMGMIPGVPDYVIVKNRKTVLVEAKSAKGKLSPQQENFHKLAMMCDVPVFVVRTIEDLEKILEDM